MGRMLNQLLTSRCTFLEHKLEERLTDTSSHEMSARRVIAALEEQIELLSIAMTRQQEAYEAQIAKMCGSQLDGFDENAITCGVESDLVGASCSQALATIPENDAAWRPQKMSQQTKG